MKLINNFSITSANTRLEFGSSIRAQIANTAKNNSSGRGYWVERIRAIDQDPNKCGLSSKE